MAAGAKEKQEKTRKKQKRCYITALHKKPNFKKRKRRAKPRTIIPSLALRACVLAGSPIFAENRFSSTAPSPVYPNTRAEACPCDRATPDRAEHRADGESWQ